MPSVFRRVTRHPLGLGLDPRENRLTDIAAAVLEHVDGLAVALVDAALENAIANADVRLEAQPQARRAPRWRAVREHLAAMRAALQNLENPRLAVQSQLSTRSGKFTDLHIRLAPRPFAAGETLVFWLESKHGAQVHGTQLTDYVRDIKFVEADRHQVLVVAPRQDIAELVGVPDTMPVIAWQRVAAVMREWCRKPGVSDVERFLLGNFLLYLTEEGLMDEELFTAEHAFVLAAHPAADDASAKLVEMADDHVGGHWATRGPTAGGRNPAYGTDYWAHYPVVTKGRKPARWRSVVFGWGLMQDHLREEPRNGWVFWAGAMAVAARNSPFTVASNQEWMAKRHSEGFEYVPAVSWTLARFKYPEELLAHRIMEDQAQALGGWVVESFNLLAAAPPPR